MENIIDKWRQGEMAILNQEEKSDCVVLLVRPYSMHPDDWYLSVVMAQLPNNNVHPYVTWGCNVSFGDVRYFEGHYFKEKEEAFEDWKKR